MMTIATAELAALKIWLILKYSTILTNRAFPAELGNTFSLIGKAREDAMSGNDVAPFFARLSLLVTIVCLSILA